MKKLFLFLLFIFVLIISYIFVSNKPKSYEVVYDKDGFNVTEKYNLNDNLYIFKIKNNNSSFDYVIDKRYSKSRKIIDKINILENKEYLCINIKIDKNVYPTICADGDNYIDSYLAGINNNEDNKKISNYNGVDIYNDNYDYLLWNGYGLTDIINKKEYNFLDDESYDNNLAYKLDNYILFADYDANREFNKFYIFNNNNKKISEWKIEFNISESSYFMGDVDGYIYLFDKKNKIQYKININKKSITISSDENGAPFYNAGWTTKTLNKLSYNEVLFTYDDIYQFSIDSNKLYYNYINSDRLIRISENEVADIIDINDDTVYYLSGESLYLYNVYKGKSKLLNYFEWNFSYKNKIFIFN